MDATEPELTKENLLKLQNLNLIQEPSSETALRHPEQTQIRFETPHSSSSMSSKDSMIGLESTSSKGINAVRQNFFQVGKCMMEENKFDVKQR